MQTLDFNCNTNLNLPIIFIKLKVGQQLAHSQLVKEDFLKRVLTTSLPTFILQV